MNIIIYQQYLKTVKMKTLYFLLILSGMSYILCEETSSPRVIIVGAGPSGIAAASRLFLNGFNNVTILEAENRIGGRVYSVEMGEYMIDIGGQWVHGEENNVAFELAWPLGLLEKFPYPTKAKLFGSSGSGVPSNITNEIIIHHLSYADHIPEDLSDLKTKSIGEYMEKKFSEFFKMYPEITPDQQKSIFHFLSLFEMGYQPADDWYHLSAKRLRDSATNNGDQDINWKNRTYSTILDILMKRYPNPQEELPVLQNTILNTKVTKINYDTNDGSKTLLTEDGKEYSADHIIFTGSLGVLKANYETMFDPPLPALKINAIKNIGFGHVAKIFLYYEDPWWSDDIYLRGFIWSKEDWKEMEKNLKERWILSAYGVILVEHKPKLICVWLTGPYVTEMELVPDDVVFNRTLALLDRFFRHDYNLTIPSMMKRSLWNSNDNFRGTYSYPTIEAEEANTYPADLAEPIMKDSKPTLQFAGEATAEYYGTVHGAIGSGWREADRLINLYSLKNNNNNTNTKN